MKIITPILVTILLLVLVIFAMGGGHGTYLPAKVIFPYSMLISHFQNKIGLIPLFLASIQVPAYFYLFKKKTQWKYLLIILHIGAIIWSINSTNDIFWR